MPQVLSFNIKSVIHKNPCPDVRKMLSGSDVLWMAVNIVHCFREQALCGDQVQLICLGGKLFLRNRKLSVEVWTQNDICIFRHDLSLVGPEGTKFCRCLLQIRVIRGVHEQLVRLLSQSEQKELRIKESFSPFSGQNPLQYNPYTEPLWRAAVDQYNRAMAPAEQRIAGKLRNQFRGLEQNSQQVTTLHPMAKLRLYMKCFVHMYFLLSFLNRQCICFCT